PLDVELCYPRALNDVFWTKTCTTWNGLLHRMFSALDDLDADSRNFLAVRASKTAANCRFRSAFYIAAVADPRLINGVIAVLQARGSRLPDGYRSRGCRRPF